MRRQARRRGDLAGTLDQVRAALDQALAAERDTLAGQDDDAARLAEMELATLPDDVAGQVRALTDYDWQSPEARAAYESIRDMLRNEVLDAQFAGMKQALTSGDPQAMQAVRDMLADLNALLAAHARGEDTTDQFNEFMDKHGDLFPEEPEGRRRADRRPGPPAGRRGADDGLAQPGAARGAGPADERRPRRRRPGLGDGPARGQPAGAAPRDGPAQPGRDAARRAVPRLQRRGGGGGRARGPGVPRAAAVPGLPRLDPGRRGRRAAGAAARLAPPARDLEALRQLERELEQQGYLSRGDDGLRLTPRAVRRLGETALKRVFATLDASGRGDHDDRHTGQADERTGLTRPWVFGDELPLDASRTVANALSRAGLPSGGVQLMVEDFEVVETERRTTAAVALCVDMSYSMVQEGRWGPMKQTALALSHLVETRFRAGRAAGDRVQPRRAPALAGAAGRRRAGVGAGHQPAARADAGLDGTCAGTPTPSRSCWWSPTASRPPTSATTACPSSSGRPRQQTLRDTVAQVDELSRYGATLNVFMLGEDPGLARFVDAIARRAGGRVFTPDLGRLGEYVVSDYLRARRGRR